MKELFRLYAAFFRIGLFTFGGGYAMIPMLEKEVVERYGWASEEELMDYYAIGQCTPGVIAVNTATFIGHKRHGVIGSVFATLGVISPSLIIILLIAALLDHFSDIEAVRHAFNGIRAAVVALILASVIKLVKKSEIDIPTLIVGIVVLALSIFTNISPAIYVVAAGAAGVLVKYFKGRCGK